MKTIKLLPAISLFVPGIAFAQPESSETTTGFDHPVPAVKNAVEIGVAVGYTQGGGKLGGGMGNLEDVSHQGGTVELSLGYRILPQLSVGAYGSFAQYSRGDAIDSNTDVLGATAGIQTAWHIRPARSVDPWLSFGAGWKSLWFSPSNGSTTSLQGIELARLQLGVDYRLSKDIAIAPVIGGSISTFVSQDMTMANQTEINDKKVSLTGFAGLSGRFDLGGVR
jgi:hypothetical protein